MFRDQTFHLNGSKMRQYVSMVNVGHLFGNLIKYEQKHDFQYYPFKQ